MYNQIAIPDAGPRPASAGAAALLFLGMCLPFCGTGSRFDVARVSEWRDSVKMRVAVDIRTEPFSDDASAVDSRTPAAQLANIRAVFNPAISDLADAFGVSRQAIYKWINGDSKPEDENHVRIAALSHAADALVRANVNHVPALLKMKTFDGRTLLDLAGTGQITPAHLQMLIDEARAMDAAYSRSGLAQSTTAPTDDWRSNISIPGVPEA